MSESVKCDPNRLFHEQQAQEVNGRHDGKYRDCEIALVSPRKVARSHCEHGPGSAAERTWLSRQLCERTKTELFEIRGEIYHIEFLGERQSVRVGNVSHRDNNHVDKRPDTATAQGEEFADSNSGVPKVKAVDSQPAKENTQQ